MYVCIVKLFDNGLVLTQDLHSSDQSDCGSDHFAYLSHRNNIVAMGESQVSIRPSFELLRAPESRTSSSDHASNTGLAFTENYLITTPSHNNLLTVCSIPLV